MKRFSALFLASLFLPAVLYAEYFDINRFGSRIEISKNGTVYVGEMIDVTFSSERHGIYRLIPFRSQVNGKNYTVYLGQFSSNWPLKVTREGSNVKLRMGNADSYVNGEQSYTLNYRANKVLLTDNTNYDELYWNVTGNGWETSIYSTHIEVVVPQPIRLGENLDYRVYAGSYGEDTLISSSIEPDEVDASNILSQAEQAPGIQKAARRRSGEAANVRGVTVSVESNRLIIDVQKRLDPYEGITIQVRMRKGMIEVPVWKKIWYNVLFFIQSYIHLILALLLFLVSFGIWWKYGKDMKTPPLMTEFLPPKDLAPSEANSILKQSPVFDISATLVDLAVRGYILIGEEKNKPYLEQVKAPDGNLRSYEKKLMEGLFSSSYMTSKEHPGRVYTSALEDSFYVEYNLVTSDFKEQFEKQVFFEKKGDIWRGVYVFFIFLTVMLLMFGWVVFKNYLKLFTFGIIALVNNIVFAAIMPKKTVKGFDYYLKILGFREFVSRADKDRIRKLMTDTPTYFDDTIPYAILFGLAKKWGRMFDDIIKEPPNWYRTDSWGAQGFRTAYFASLLSSNMHHIGAAAVSQPSSSGSGGSWSSGGGGFSGGGFGGGGGGSW